MDLTAQEVFQQFERFIIESYRRTPRVIVRGCGSELFDESGRRILDFFAGWGVSILGHCHPRVVEAVRRQAEDLLHIDNTFYHPQQGRLAKLLSECSFGGKCFFCNSGAEANEAALKLARRAVPERYRVITTQGAFHGRTFGALSATGQSQMQEGTEPLLAGFRHVPFDDVDGVANAIDEETAAVMIEPIQGEAGVRVPADDYLPALRQLCDDRGVLLILDEVQTGMGRTGRWFACQHADVTPDIMTVAKALGGGVAIGAMIAREDVADVFGPGTHGTTFGGNPLACAAAAATIETIDAEGLLNRATEIGGHFKRRLEELRERVGVIEEVRGRGAMIAATLSTPAQPVAAAALERGLRVGAGHDHVLRMLPALTITDEQINEGLDLLAEVLASATAVPTGQNA